MNVLFFDVIHYNEILSSPIGKLNHMEENTLGLPLEYNELSEYFDALAQGDDHSKNRAIEKILKQRNVETVLDLTCGTGSQVFWLQKCGYKVLGVDFSPALLDIARNKAKKDKIEVEFIEGDMRTIKIGNFDAVITIANAIGHLTKLDFEKTLQNIKRNLKTSGIYIFDIFNLEAMTDNAVKNLAMDISGIYKNNKIRNIQYSKLDKSSGLLTSYDKFIIQEGVNKEKNLKSKFTLQIYTARELRQTLAKNGFKTLSQYGINGEIFLENESMSILTVAMKAD